MLARLSRTSRTSRAAVTSLSTAWAGSTLRAPLLAVWSSYAVVLLYGGSYGVIRGPMGRAADRRAGAQRSAAWRPRPAHAPPRLGFGRTSLFRKRDT
jgi:hypothetical protein